jgi:hypothetical protein
MTSKLFESVLKELASVKSHREDFDFESRQSNAEQYFDYCLEGEKFDLPDGRQVTFGERGWREYNFSLRQAIKGDIGKAASKEFKERVVDNDLVPEEIAAVEGLSDVLKSAKCIQYKRNAKPDKKPDVKGYEKWAGAINIDGRTHNIEIMLEVPFGHHAKSYYYHVVESKQKPLKIVAFKII